LHENYCKINLLTNEIVFDKQPPLYLLFDICISQFLDLSWAIVEVVVAKGRGRSAIVILCGTASDTVDAARSAIQKGYKF
jgi:hypothetical protein